MNLKSLQNNMDIHHRIVVVFKEYLSLENAQNVVLNSFNRMTEGSYELDLEFTYPIACEYEENIFINSFCFNDEFFNGRETNSWFSINLNVYTANKTDRLYILPSNHPGRDFILDNEGKILHQLIENEYIDFVFYSLESEIHVFDVVTNLKNGLPILKKYSIHKILPEGRFKKM